MRLSEFVYVVGGGDAGFNLSGRIDANCYVVDTAEGLWMIDVGFDSGERILDNIRREGLDPGDITRIFLTHNHADHAGALAYMRSALSTNVQVAISTEVAEHVRVGDPDVNGFRWAQKVGFYPTTFQLAPSVVDVELLDGQEFVSGRVRLTALATPGHSLGHFAFLVEGAGPICLFSGDQIFWGGAILLQNLPDVDIQAYAESMNKLAVLDFESLLPGHSGVSMEHGKRHVDAAVEQFSRIGVPPGLF